MNSLMQVANGFLWGVGLILAVAVMRATVHLGIC